MVHEVSWLEARARARGLVALGPTEQVALSDSLGRTLATNVEARTDVPGFATAAMDGWVVRGPGPWREVGTIDAGRPSNRELRPGESMRISTGGVIPSGGEAVIPWEVARVADGVLDAEPQKRRHIRPSAEECREGERIAVAGDQVNPALLGMFAAAGLDSLPVVVLPRVAVRVLGDEVVHHGVPALGSVRDALGVQIPGWVTALGGTAMNAESVPDDFDLLVNSLSVGAEVADLILCTGGTSRGRRDFLRGAVERLSGSWIVESVAVRPGHPMMLATVEGTPVVGLPGNPLSALAAMMTLVAPMIRTWLAVSGDVPCDVRVATKQEPSPKATTRLMVGRRERGEFQEVSYVSSAMLRGIAYADGWAVIPPEGVAAGDSVEWLPVPWLRRTSV